MARRGGEGGVTLRARGGGGGDDGGSGGGRGSNEEREGIRWERESAIRGR